MTKKLCEPQESLVRKLKAGAKLQHDLASGLFRLQDGPLRRSIHPATVQSLLVAGVIRKSLGGDCALT
jgi:hypothetical protein